MNVGFGRHGQSEEVVGGRAEEAFDQDSGLFVAALVTGDRSIIELLDGEARLDRRQLGLLRLGGPVELAQRRRRKVQRSWIKVDLKQALGTGESVVRISLKQFLASGKHLRKARVVGLNWREPAGITHTKIP